MTHPMPSNGTDGMTPAELRFLEAVPTDRWATVRRVAHVACLPHGRSLEACRALARIGAIEWAGEPLGGSWHGGAGLVRRQVEEAARA